MRVIVCEDYKEMSLRAAKLVASQMTLKPNCVLGLATGSTPIGLYDKLVEMNKMGEIDFSDVTTFNLDEYYPIAPDNDQSYRYFMNENLFNKINIDKANTYVPDGASADPDKACADYEKIVDSMQKRVIVIENGHVAHDEKKGGYSYVD